MSKLIQKCTIDAEYQYAFFPLPNNNADYLEHINKIGKNGWFLINTDTLLFSKMIGWIAVCNTDYSEKPETECVANLEV